MSFSKEVKDELLKVKYDNQCCKKALLYGLAIFGRSFSPSSVLLQTEHKGVAELYSDLMHQEFNIDTEIIPTPKGRNYHVFVSKKQDCEKVMKAFAHSGNESLKINHANFYCDCCTGAFLAGAFLACGTISSPQKDYHLEFAIPFYNLSKSLVTLLEELDLTPKYANRKGYNIVYFKESETIENFLYIMGASNAMFDMMNIQIVKDFRNKANRRTNCENANINKLAEASAVQLNAIERIWKAKGHEFLTKTLEYTAELRFDNPDLSLGELADLADGDISRSGMNHRLKRIVDIASTLK